MSAYAPDKAATVVPFAPTPKGQQPEVVADESGRTIVAMLQKAADMAKEDCSRAEAWLLRIHNEVEQTFFAKKEREPRQAPRP
jgi:hypothetical protein